MRFKSMLAVLAIVAASLIPASVSAASTGTCDDRPVTIIANSAHTVGTAGDDVIIVRGDWIGGNHVTVDARGGNDAVCVWYTNATVNLGSGNDYFSSINNGSRPHGYKSNVSGGPGDDLIALNEGTSSSSADGGPGNDVCGQRRTPGFSQAKFWRCETIYLNDTTR